jgi:hypothetical protein
MEKLLVAVADNKPEAVVVEHVKPEPGEGRMHHARRVEKGNCLVAVASTTLVTTMAPTTAPITAILFLFMIGHAVYSENQNNANAEPCHLTELSEV